MLYYNASYAHYWLISARFLLEIAASLASLGSLYEVLWRIGYPIYISFIDFSGEAFEIKVVTTESREDKQRSPFNWDKGFKTADIVYSLLKSLRVNLCHVPLYQAGDCG